jgi:hypothetical protein
MPSKTSESIVKSEFLVDKINEIMNLKNVVMRTLSVLDTRPAFNEEELSSITSFLMNYNSQKPIKFAQDKLEEVTKKEFILQCKKCGETSDYTTQNGRFGYFINCNKCNTNTPMKMPCTNCRSKITKVSKSKSRFYLNCKECNKKINLI